MNVFLMILGIVLCVIFLIYFFYILLVGKYNDKKFNKACLSLVGLGVIMMLASASFTIIPTGYTGVRTTFGQVDDVTLQNGFNWKMPFAQNIAIVNNKQQDIVFSEEDIWSETKERTVISYSGITVTYQINPEKSAWIYANISDYENNLVSNSLVGSAIKSSSKTLSDTDATNRSIVEPLARKNIQNSLNEKYGEDVIYVNKVVINNADFEDSYNKAIADKQKTQLAAEQQAIENQKNIDKADADAEVAKKKAEGEAEAKKIKAKADAEANNMLSKSLTDKVLKDKYIDKWDGKMPKVVSDKSSLMYDINSDKE